MSADNGIYIGVFADGEVRVIHAQSIGNLWYPGDENPTYIVDYYKYAPPLKNLDEGLRAAEEMYESTMEDDFPIIEYGISILRFSKSFSEYEKEAKLHPFNDETFPRF